MASRAYKPASKVLYTGAITVEGRLTVGASGAVTSWVGYGIASVTKEATAGQYTFVLEDPYKTFVYGSAFQVAATAADITFQFLSEDVGNATQASRKVVLQAKTAATGADVASGSVITVQMRLANSQLAVGNTVT